MAASKKTRPAGERLAPDVQATRENETSTKIVGFSSTSLVPGCKIRGPHTTVTSGYT